MGIFAAAALLPVARKLAFFSALGLAGWINRPDAADIRAAALERDGYAIIDVAIAPDEDQALLRYLDQQKALARPAPQSHTTATAPMPAAGPSPVLGLFPEALR